MSEVEETLEPELRFPEFRDTGEWKSKPLGKLYTFKVTNSFSRAKLNYDEGTVRNIHYGDIHTKFPALFNLEKEDVPYIDPTQSIERIKEENYCVEGDLVFADASEDLDDIGKTIEIVNLNGEKLLAGLHTLLARQKASTLVSGFGGYLFKSSGIRKQIKTEAQGAKVLGISAGRLAGINIYFPAKHQEQRKIVDCLSSIDELITVQSRRLESLKAHKKGLLQHLFPAEGETVPKLRFPEFRDAGAWKKAKFDDLMKIISGKGFKASEYSSSGIRLLQIENVGYGTTKWGDNLNYLPESYTLEHPELVLQEGDIVLALNRPVTNNNLKIARITKQDKPVLLYQRVGKLEIIDESIVNDFIFQTCQSFIKDFVTRQSIGSDQPFISLRTLYAQEITIPSLDEQQKIADCLSSTDELITAQAQKLESLKEHKKGLMQKLFPSPEGV